MDNETRYYNQESLWGEVAEYQKNVLTDIQHNIPADVKSILDVGCGDGFVINSLAGKYECTGVDISETALKSVQCRKMVASATELPFEDDSFDLVMINDVIEHLPGEILTAALRELQRVTRKYLLITVPFMENLNAGMTYCRGCGSVYHITHHVNAFGVKELTGLFDGGKLHPVKVIYSGSEHQTADLLQYELRSAMNFYTAWDKAMCPVCGKCCSDKLIGDSSANAFYGDIAAVSKHPFPHIMPSRNECIVLWSAVEKPALSEQGITAFAGGQQLAGAIDCRNDRAFFVSETPADTLQLIHNNVVHLLPRPSVQDGLAVIPQWFAAEVIDRLTSAQAPDDLVTKYQNWLLDVHTNTLDSNQSEISNLRARVQYLEEYIELKRAGKLKFYWRRHKKYIEDTATPDTMAQIPADGKPHFTVICHDQDIDRRILQQVELLTQAGWSGAIVCLSFDAEDHIENGENYIIHRIGLKHIVPDNKCFWTYQKLSYLLSRTFFSGRLTNRLLFRLYQLCNVMYYRCSAVTDPLPFNRAFYNAGALYPADLVLGEDLPALKAAVQLAQAWNSKLIFDSHEFYPEQRVFSSKQKKIMHSYTREYIGKCHGVITVSDGIADKFAEYYNTDRPLVLHNVTNRQIVPPSNRLRETLELDDTQKIILYQGGIIPDRNIEKLVEGFVKLDPVNAHLVLMGPSDPLFLDSLKACAAKLRIPKVHFLDAVPRSELLSYTASADFGVVPYKVIDLNTRYCMPNKFFEFIQAGLPILANELIEVNKILENIGGGGMVTNLNTADNVAKALGKMLQRDLKHDRALLKNAGERYSWEYESKMFMEMVDKVRKG